MPLPDYAVIREHHIYKIENDDLTYQKFFINKDITILEDNTELIYITINRVENYDLIKEVLNEC